MPEPLTPKSTKPRARRGVRGAVIFGLLVAASIVGIAVYRHYADPERVRAAAESYLQRLTNGRVRVASASFSIMNGIRLNDVTVWEPLRHDSKAVPTPVPREPAFSCHEISIAHNPWALIRGRLEIESLVATEPTCMLIHDSATGWTAAAGLLREITPDDAASLSPPPIELRDARLRLVHRTPQSDRLVEDMRITVRGRRSPNNPRLFDLVWQGGPDPTTGGHSQIDLATGYLRNVRGGLPTMSVGAVMLAIDAGYEGADALGDLLGLQGRVRALDYNLIGPPLDNAPRSATIELRDASLSIPAGADEHDLPADHRYLHFEGVNGSFVITANAVLADFTGVFHGSECRVSARIHGDLRHVATLDDVDVDADLSVTRLDLPRVDPQAPLEQQRFVEHWPQLTHFFEDYDPHGPIDIDLNVAKPAGANASIVVRRALLTARGGDASCRYFPYRGDQLTGSVEFTPDGVHVRDVCGRHGTARVCVNVWMEAPRRTAAARVDISATNVPLDETLHAGLQPQYRRLIDPFTPAGLVNAVVEMRRPTSTDDDMAPWKTTARVTFDDLSAKYDRFPYPVDHLSGRIVLDHDRISVHDIVGRAGQGQLRIDGTADLNNAEVTAFDFQIDAADVAVDESLLAALPPAVRRRVQSFDPRGCVDANTSLMLDAAALELRHESDIRPHGLTMTYDQFPLRVTDVGGRMHINADRINIETIYGRYNDAELSASGAIGLDPRLPSADVSIRARNLLLDDSLRAAAPQGVRAALSAWRIDDPIATDAQITSHPDNPDKLRCRAFSRLTGATVRHERFPLPFRDVRAEIHIDESGAQAHAVSARYGEAAVRVDFQSRRNDHGENGVIRLHAAGASLDEGVRGLLPEHMRGLWDQLGPSGRIDLRLDELSYASPGGDQPATWTVKGQADLRGAILSGIAESARVNGTVSFDGMLVDRLGGTTLSGRFDKTDATLYGREVRTAEGRWSYARTAAGEGCLILERMNGRIYDGALAADAELVFDSSHANYKLSATTQGMQIAPFINASRARRSEVLPARSSGEPLDVRGLVDAHLYLSGEWNRPATRRGGGRIEIFDGYIYRLPILLAILNVLNITVPGTDVLDEARIEFFVAGNAVTLSDILLRGAALSLVGKGTMSMPDQGVDLTLVNLGSARFSKVPVLAELLEGASRELVELRVTGPLSQPTVRASPLRGITEELKQLFQKRKPRKVVQGGT